jgi:hypothetical protein
VQRVPYIGGPIYRFFGDPHRDRVLAWIVGEVVLEGGDEEDWCNALAEVGLCPSGDLDHLRRLGPVPAQPPRSRRRAAAALEGPRLFDIIRGMGYTTHQAAGPEVQADNPQIVDRSARSRR